MTATLSLDCTGNSSATLVRSADELRRALRAARDRAVTLDISGLNRMLRLDAERRSIEVQAATPWSALAACTGQPLDPGLPGTIGDAVSANAPGPDGIPIVSHVETLTLVTPDGDVRRADRHAHPDLFALAVGGYGLAGVLYSVTLRIDSLARAIKDAEEPVVLDLAQPCPGAPRTAEFLVPPDRLDAVLESFKNFARERRIGLERISVRRLRPEGETLLRWATREWAQVTLWYSMRRTRASPSCSAAIPSSPNSSRRRNGSTPPSDCKAVGIDAPPRRCAVSSRSTRPSRRAARSPRRATRKARRSAARPARRANRRRA